MSSRAAPDDSARAFVIASMIFGTDSSVTLRSYSLTSTSAISASSFVPGLGVATPAVSVMPFDDHPGVLPQLGRLERLEQGLRHALDDARLELGAQSPLEQLDPDERHRASSLPFDVPGAAVAPEHEIELAVRHVLERHRPERLHQ